MKHFLTYILSDGKQAAKEIGDKVSDVGVKIEDVGDKVQCVDDKVQVVIDGARGFSVDCQTIITSRLLDGQQARVAAKDIGDKVQVVIDGA